MRDAALKLLANKIYPIARWAKDLHDSRQEEKGACSQLKWGCANSQAARLLTVFAYATLSSFCVQKVESLRILLAHFHCPFGYQKRVSFWCPPALARKCADERGLENKLFFSNLKVRARCPMSTKYARELVRDSTAVRHVVRYVSLFEESILVNTHSVECSWGVS